MMFPAWSHGEKGIPRLLLSLMSFVTTIRMVTIKTTTSVEVREGADLVILQCEYELEKPNATFNFEWQRNGYDVLERYSDGQVKCGSEYDGRVSLGEEGCSLVLNNPKPSDSGRYTVHIISPGKKNYDKATVELIVGSFTQETQGPIYIGYSNVTTAAPRPQPEEAKPDVISCLPAFISTLLLSALAIGRIVFLVLYHMRVTRRSQWSLTKDNRTFHYMTVGFIFFVFATSSCLSATGLVHPDDISCGGTIATTAVGFAFLFTHDCCLQRCSAKMYGYEDNADTNERLTGPQRRREISDPVE